MNAIPGPRCAVICEISANHRGSFAGALALVQACADAGAPAVKIQTWHPEKMVLDRDYVLASGPWAGRNLAELYREAWTPWEWHAEIFALAKRLGMVAFTSVFDLESLAYLEAQHQVPVYKVASFELVDHILIRAIAKTGKPMILSTGMAALVEIREAVNAARSAGCRDLTLLRCTSAYPAGAAQANLRTMRHMAEHFDCQVGLSDHTPGIGVAVAAAAFGATMVEKHVCLPQMPGEAPTLDQAFSITPAALRELVTAAADAALAPGEANAYGPTIGEAPQFLLRRSLHFARDLRAGETITLEHIRTARPATGLSPRYLRTILGKQALTDAKAGAPVTWALVEPADAIAAANIARV